MRIKILGWRCVNIRKFKDFEVDLSGDTDKSCLIMMRNGTGKTTTIGLIRAVLSGSAVGWGEGKVREFAPMGTEIPRGEFHLKVRYDQKPYHYILHLDYDRGTAFYETSRMGPRGGLEAGRTLPIELRGIMDQENFVNRFIFDGEQAKMTLGKGNKEAEKAILYLYQVNKLDGLKNEVKSLVKRKQENSEKSLERSIKIYKKKMERGECNYCELVELAKRHKTNLESSKNRLGELEQRYNDIIAADEKLEREQKHLFAEKKEQRALLSSVIGEILDQSKKPYNVSSVLDKRLKWLSRNMQVLKLPKTTAQEFFKELAESETCVCGHHIGEDEKRAILENAQKYLGQEQLVTLNAIKHTLRGYETSDVIGEKLAELGEIVDQLRKIRNDMERIATEAERSGNPEVSQIREEMGRLQQEIFHYEERLRRLETKDYVTYPDLSEDSNIEKARRFWENAKENYLRETDTYIFTKKAEKMIQYIDAVRESSLKKLKKNILDTSNEKIAKIISNDFIQIEKIDGDLVLKNRKGLSEGQTLAVAYAYIGSLFEHSEIEFPFVVDSPAASMDLEVRREVARVLPELFQQLIIFVTSGEVAGFGESFYPMENVRYLTIEERDHEIQCTEGQTYFSQYQNEED